jgi:hypothetical protein
MEKKRFLHGLLLFLFSIPLILSFHTRVGSAAEGEDDPIRQAPVVVSYDRYKWWLIRWVDNLILCTVYTDQEGLPSGDDIYTACGKTIYDDWAGTPPCTRSAAECEGVYLHFVSKEPAEKTIQVEYPPPQVTLSLSNCPRPAADNLCDRIPSLVFTGEEPIPGETITSIRGFFNGEPFLCPGSTCEIPLRPTTARGVPVDFVAESSFGDVSATFTAQARVVESGVSADPSLKGWYVDVLSAQWRGEPQPACAQIWDAFAPVGAPPDWLSTPAAPELLATENPYYYLAGRLIAQGVVDASACPVSGLQANGYADECGLKAAQPQVTEWQNRFDAQILAVANEVSIPAQLLKNIFAQESQFWPGAFKDPHEFGLGQLTDSGAETILLWDTRFFFQFCPTVFDNETCQRGYVYLSKEHQQLLRGALANQVRADCPNCAAGIDLDNVSNSVNLFAHTLVANCAQVSRIIYNASERSPGQISDYENLWRFTAANYHIGPGCMSYAIYSAWVRRDPMDWAHVSTYLTPSCQSAIRYVENLTK